MFNGFQWCSDSVLMINCYRSIVEIIQFTDDGIYIYIYIIFMYFPTNKINTHDDTHTHTNIFFKKNKDVHISIWLYIRMNSDVSYKHHVLAMNPLSCQPTFSSYLEPPVLIVGLRSRWCQVPC